jgi:hypothetical protein
MQPKKPLFYLNNLLDFLGGNEDEFPLSPWLASLGQDDLDFLVGSIEGYFRRDEEMPDDMFADVLGVVLKMLSVEEKAESLSCTEEKLQHYFFTLSICGAFEQLRRAGLARILSPMMLTSEYAPEVEIIKELGPDF